MLAVGPLFYLPDTERVPSACTSLCPFPRKCRLPLIVDINDLHDGVNEVPNDLLPHLISLTEEVEVHGSVAKLGQSFE